MFMKSGYTDLGAVILQADSGQSPLTCQILNLFNIWWLVVTGVTVSERDVNAIPHLIDVHTNQKQSF